MKNLKRIYKSILIILVIISCTDSRDLDFLETVALPTNISATYDITQDNTGLVTITPLGEGAVTFEIDLGDGSEAVAINSGESTGHTFAEGNYDITITAFNVVGDSAQATQQLIVSFQAPQNLVVVLENDASISKQVNITANADFATMYDFDSGAMGATVVSANIGETINYQYSDPGTYSISLIAKGAAIETTEYTVDFEVTEILAPTVAAPEPPARNASDVVSVFSEAYTNVILDELPTPWSSTGFEATTIGSDNVWKLTTLDFLGIVSNYTSGIDLSTMEKMHIDYWVPDGTTNELLVKIVNTVDGGEDIESLGTTIGGSWQSIELDMTGFDGGDLANKEKITQLIIDSDGIAPVVYIDNFYFWKAPTTFPNISDDFEGNGTIAAWFGDSCGSDPAFANPYVDANNPSATVLEYNDTGGQYANIRFDTSPNFDFSSKKSFSLKVYVASSDVTGTQPNQISLKLQDGTVAQPWVQQTEVVKPIVLDAWQTIIFDFENDPTLGAANPLNRTDFNRVVIQVNSENNTDNVKAYIDDFQWGDDLFVGPIPQDDFEGAGNITTWFGDSCGLDAAFSNPFTDATNPSATVLEYDDTGGQYANIRFDTPSNFNMQKHTFSIKIYVASTDLSGTQPNQVSLKLQDGTVSQPWVQQTEVVKPIVLDAWQTITFNFATDPTGGAANPLTRTDFNRVVLQINSENNTDAVKAYIDDFNYN